MPSGDPEDSIAIAIDALESRLRRQYDERVKIALQITGYRIAGYNAREIQDRLNLTQDEYRRIRRELRQAAAAPD